MNLETISRKQLNEMEHHVRELLAVLRRARVMNDPLVESLKQLEHQLGEMRRERFDAVNTEYHTH